MVVSLGQSIGCVRLLVPLCRTDLKSDFFFIVKYVSSLLSLLTLVHSDLCYLLLLIIKHPPHFSISGVRLCYKSIYLFIINFFKSSPEDIVFIASKEEGKKDRKIDVREKHGSKWTSLHIFIQSFHFQLFFVFKCSEICL